MTARPSDDESTLLRPPNQSILRWLDLLTLPLMTGVTIVATSLAIGVTPAWPHLLWWVPGSLLFLAGAIVAVRSRSPWTSLPPWLRLHAIEWAGFLGWCWVTLLFLFASSSLSPLTLAILWPAFIPPTVLFLLHRAPVSRTTRVLLLISATALVLLFCAQQAIRRVEPPAPFPWPIEALSLFLVVLWLVTGLCIVYYVVRRLQLEQIRAEILRQVMVDLAVLGDPFAYAEQIVELLLSRAQLGDRIFILQYHPQSDAIQVVAWAGKDAGRAAYKELDLDRGIARRAIRTGRSQNVPDVTRDPDFVAADLPAYGSELAVPIPLRSGPRQEILGTITVQSNTTHAFDRRDEQVVEQLCQLLGAFGHNHADGFDDQMADALEAQFFYRLRGSEDLAGAAVSVAHHLFDAALTCYVRLTVGTDVPYGPPFIVGEFREPDYLLDPARLAPDGDLADWAVQWKPHFFSRHTSGTVEPTHPLATIWGYAKECEGATAMAALPIGSRNTRTGLLLLFWREHHLFSRAEIINLLSFAREIAPYIEREQYRETIYLGFARLQSHFHSTMAEAGLARGRWEHILQQAIERDEVAEEHALRDQLVSLQSGLRQFLNRLRSAESDEAAKFSQLGYVSLREALRKGCAGLQQHLSGPVLREVAPEISAENNDVKLILYTMIMEAARNALIHGRSEEIPTVQAHVRVRRLPRAIEVHVSDDGCGFDPRAHLASLEEGGAGSLNPDGIFFLDQLAQQRLAAPPIDWLDSALERGTRLIWTLPALPPIGSPQP